ncbi:VanW family protein [Gordonia sp. NPDC003950]
MGPLSSRHRRTGIRVAIGVTAVISLVLALDLVVTSGHTARGATVAGRDVGNLSQPQVTSELAELSELSRQPVTLRTSSGEVAVAPDSLGLTFDADATAAALSVQPRNPFARLAALFGLSRDVEPVVGLDPTRFDAALDDQKGSLERAAVDGGVHYDGTQPVADMPAAGLRVDRDAARPVLTREWLDGGIVELPMEPFAPTVAADVVTATVAGPARTAVADDLAVEGRDGINVRLTPAQIASALTFRPDGRGGLVPHVDRDRGRTILAGLSRSESRPVNARFSLSTGSPVVIAARDGHALDWEATFIAIEKMITGDGPRTVEATYRVLPPALTTRAARDLGVTEVISEFTTGGFSSASGENIRLVAQEVDGALILPGRSFSLNGYTGPRGTAQGYVTSTIIDHGRASRAVGGGISQFATTLYNAAYFAGLDDVDHTEHAYYISRYPEAREATVFEGAIDLVIGNRSRHGVLIETSWSPSSVTVRMWGTKTVDVQSITGSRVNYTSPEIRTIAGDDNCIASRGSRGFTASNTRIITDAATGTEIRRHTRTVRYDPEPIVRCVS